MGSIMARPVKQGPPPANLVQLSTVPRDTWMGRKVWHPMSQHGDTPHWKPNQEPEWMRDPEDDPDEYCYDVGLVTHFEWYEIAEDWERWEVWFKDPDDKAEWMGLHYAADNLWVEP